MLVGSDHSGVHQSQGFAAVGRGGGGCIGGSFGGCGLRGSCLILGEHGHTGCAVIALLGNQLQQNAQVVDLFPPFLGAHVQQVTIGKLGDRLQQGGLVHRAQVHFTLMHGGLPSILGHVGAIAGTRAGQAGGECLGRVAHDLFHILILVHAVEVDGLLQVGVHGLEVLLGDHVLQSAADIVVVADVQVVAVDLQGAGTGADALRVHAVSIFCLGIALTLGIASQHRPMPVLALGGIGAGQFAAHNGKGGFHAVVRVLGSFIAHANNNIQLVVELQHLINTAAAIDIAALAGRGHTQAVKLGLAQDLGKGILPGRGIVGNCQESALVRVQAACDQRGLVLAVGVSRNGTGGGEVPFIDVRQRCAVCGGQFAVIIDILNTAVIDAGDFVSLDRVDLVDAGEAALDGNRGLILPFGQARSIAVDGHTDKVQLVTDLRRAAQDVDHARAALISRLCHQNFCLAGLDVELVQDTASGNAVRLTDVHVAIVHHIDGRLGDLRVQVAKAAGQDGVCAQAAVHGADVDPIAVTLGRIAVGLAAVAVVLGAGTLHIGADFAVAQVVNHAVIGLGTKVCVGDLFPGGAVYGIVGVLYVDLLCALGKRRQGSGCKQCRAQGKRCNALCNSIQVHAWLPYL